MSSKQEVLLDIKKIKNIKEYDDWIAEQKRIKMSKYYYQHRDTILDKRRETFECECGRTVSYGSKYAHEHSKLHTQWIKKMISMNVSE
jgi:hypothetical protein